MDPLDALLGTNEAAERLRVSVSTVKRWIDSGAIQAEKTPGGHRRILLSEVDRMARQLARAGTAGGRGASSRVDDESRERLLELLRRGEGRAARDLLTMLSRAGCRADELADDLIRPTMERIGHGWLIGTIDVFEEHEASMAVAGALDELIAERAARPSSGPLAVGSTPEGDPYILSCLLCELLLREQGWQVRNLGANLPMRSLANAVIGCRPDVVYLSINHLKDEERFAREFARFHEDALSVGAAVIVGGRALSAGLRSRLPYAAFAERMAHLTEFARSRWPGAGSGSSRDEP